MKKERGVSLIELILVIIAVAILALLITSLPAAIGSIRKSGNTSTAREIASKQMDSLRKQPYANLANGTNSFTDAALSNLPSPMATYTVEDCPEGICTHGEDTKKITVKINWVESGDTKTAELYTLFSKGGLGQ